jgi:PKD repeat protein
LAQGGVAAHVFESPGTYTVTLTVTDGVNSQTTTSTITVQDPNTVFSGTNTICVSSTALPVAGAGGCPAGAAVVQSNRFGTIVNNYAQNGNRRVLLKRGDVFGGPADAVMVNRTPGPGIIGAYGTGAKPVIRLTDATNFAVVLALSSGAPTYVVDDWRVMDLDIDGQSQPNLGLINANGNYTVNRFLMLRIDAHDLGSGIVLDAGATVPEQIFFVDSTIKRIKTVPGVSSRIGSYWTVRRSGVLGNVFDDTRQGGEHLVRIAFADHAVYSHNVLRNTGVQKEMFTPARAGFTTKFAAQLSCLRHRRCGSDEVRRRLTQSDLHERLRRHDCGYRGVV